VISNRHKEIEWLDLFCVIMLVESASELLDKTLLQQELQCLRK